ncbi:hypothetical protein Dda_7106 [Drechslerella dactyloides]|uniref:chitinase n=1 Tax=Drechslerella dactyloides TaxID=74499 RepID=A0AAD6NHC0_DREDA|nr:hypothetical protein Dda_7106 [Drechslerella dactyloides]
MAIYQRNFFPSDLATEDFTHILYGFANVDPNNGKVYLSDPYADTQIMLREYGYSPGYNNLYGCLYELFWLKRKNRNLKVLLSIGGQTYSRNFSTGVNTPQKRANFATTAAKLVQNLGLDGIDLNWEFHLNEREGEHFVDLLKCCRRELQPQQEISVAAPAGKNSTHYLKISDMDKYVDFWNLMAFDFSGKYSQVAGHQANIYVSTTSPLSTNNSWVAALDQYRDVPNNKIVIGMPLYGRSFEGTDGPGTAFSGIGAGEWEPGVWDYKSLPRKGAQESNDTSALASWSYDSSLQEMISYDTPNVARQKAGYIIDHGYGGAMWWETSGDKAGDGSIIKTVVKVFKDNGKISMDIGSPDLFHHIKHIDYDHNTGGFVGLPPEWEQVLRGEITAEEVNARYNAPHRQRRFLMRHKPKYRKQSRLRLLLGICFGESPDDVDQETSPDRIVDFARL